MEKTEFKFPDEAQDEPKQEAKAKDDDIEIEVVDDTPEPDKGREPVEKSIDTLTDEDISKYELSLQHRLKKLSHGYHDERRAKEAAVREREGFEICPTNY